MSASRLGARGASASSEAADVVILADRLDRVAEAIAIAQRARRIALESIVVGMSLSMLAMVAAMLGWLAPVPAAHRSGSDRRRRHPQCLAGACTPACDRARAYHPAATGRELHGTTTSR